MPTLDERLHDASRYMYTLHIQSTKVRNHHDMNILCTSNIDLNNNFMFDDIYFLIWNDATYNINHSLCIYARFISFACDITLLSKMDAKGYHCL